MIKFSDQCDSPAQVEQMLQMDRVWSLHVNFPHLQQVVTTLLLLSAQNWHCLLTFLAGEGPAAAPCALLTKSAASEEQGR